ncbi:hypothetical protein ACFL96_08295, partial [Thermoproteota archaeon]
MKQIISTFLILLFLCGCATIYNPATQKDEYIFISTNQEANMGRSYSKQIEEKVEISKDQSLIRRVQSIGEK